MTALTTLNCSIPAQKAHRAAVRRIEAAARAREDRHESYRERCSPRYTAGPQTLHPLPALAAQILGARYQAPASGGYDAYLKASRLLSLESHRVDVTGL